ncbi:MAG: hypothetical protein OXI05_01785 [Bacteroidota bacterium]|nr:hypothetical protein [Bacteroidota bacterium]MDE2644556.1 hypothetical protein [Bacteroidota bacterium]
MVDVSPPYTMVKTEVAKRSREEVDADLLTGQLASGIYMARLRSRFSYGTREPVGVMRRERNKRAVPVSY